MFEKSDKMVIQEHTEFDIFVASKIGSFKHIKYNTDATKNSKKCIENLVEIKSLQKDDSITCLEWGNPEQTEVLVGKRNQQVQVYDTLNGLTSAYTADFAAGDIVGLGRYKRRLIAAVASGTVKIWSKKEEMLIDSGGRLDQMKVCAEEPTLFATGGEENDLKLWRIGDKEPVFSAKNLPHDWLQLRRPVWVSGLAFLGPHVAAVCSRHGYVRVYDSRGQRRPVVSVDFDKMAATCIQPSFDQRQVLVGFGRGQLHQVDLRVGKPHKGYKGACGAISSVATATAPGGRYIVSASLDRHLRVHEYHSKGLVYKQYLTSKLSAVLVQTASSTPLRHPPAPEQPMEEVKEEDDMDTLFDNMETVSEKPSKKQKIHSVPPQPPSKRAKPSAAGSSIQLEPHHSGGGAHEQREDSQEGNQDSQEDKEDAIKKLLRSTEKKKRKLEKKKKEKKAKSVFYNA